MLEHFYTSISKYYQQIFPFNPAQINFLRQVLPYNGAKVLDVGCAIGELSFALIRFGFPIWAFDFDAEMIEIRQNKLQELLEEAGFGSFEYFGSFNGEPLTKNSLPLIVTCQNENK